MPYKPRPADILLVRGRGWIASEIKAITHSPYSHVAMFVDERTLIEAQGFRRVGSQIPSVYAGIADVYSPRGISSGERQRIIRNARRHEGEVYDYPLLIVELLRFATGIIIPFPEFHCKVCSTLIASAYREENIDPTPGISRPAPSDIGLSRLFQYEGAF